MSFVHQTSRFALSTLDVERERLIDLECRSLLAEQARQQAHRLRTPLSVIKLISETLQLDLADNRSSSDRLGQLLGSVATLSSGLSDSVRSTRFGDGPARRLDAIAVAEGVVRVFGGRFAASAGRTDMSTSAGACHVMLEPDAYEAALVHALRLIGIRHSNGQPRANRPVLQWQRNDEWLRLCLWSEGPAMSPIPGERADLQMMALAVERMARDSGGTLTLTADSATFELPLISLPDSGDLLK